jgi:hyperosmotically inducible protein
MISAKKIATFMTFASCSLLSFNVLAVSDADITKDINSKIESTETTSKSKIDVTTKQGVVTLKGNLQTEGEASSAVESANSIDGVKDVDTENLMVKNSSHPYRDAYLTAKVKGSFVRAKLFGDKPVAVTSINVETKNGVVYLTGTADNKNLVATAETLAKEIKGVKSVKSTVEIKANNT